MTRVTLIVGLTLVVAVAPRVARAGEYVVVDGAALYIHNRTSVPRIRVKGPVPLRVVAKRSGFYQVETFALGRTRCAGLGERAIGRVRLWVVARTLRRKVLARKLRRFRRCGRFAGWIDATPISWAFVPSIGMNPTKARPQLRAHTALYWPDGSHAGMLTRALELDAWPRRRGRRACAPIRLWVHAQRITVCFAPGRVHRMKPVRGGVALLAPPPPPPKYGVTGRYRHKIVLEHVLERQRIAGSRRIAPPESVKLAMAQKRRLQLIAGVWMCLNRRGSVATLRVMKSSGYPAYDRRIRRVMHKWRYKPFLVNGSAVPVCTSVIVIYRRRYTYFRASPDNSRGTSALAKSLAPQPISPLLQIHPVFTVIADSTVKPMPSPIIEHPRE